LLTGRRQPRHRHYGEYVSQLFSSPPQNILQEASGRELRALPLDGKDGATTAYRIYTIDTYGFRTLTSELADTSDRVGTPGGFLCGSPLPSLKDWLLECDADDASDGESNARLH
jgi:hypothetical protein